MTTLQKLVTAMASLASDGWLHLFNITSNLVGIDDRVPLKNAAGDDLPELFKLVLPDLEGKMRRPADLWLPGTSGRNLRDRNEARHDLARLLAIELGDGFVVRERRYNSKNVDYAVRVRTAGPNIDQARAELLGE